MNIFKYLHTILMQYYCENIQITQTQIKQKQQGMKRKLLFIVVLMIPFIGIMAQSLNINSAINKAGRQRMLTQRMTKDYMMIGSEVKVESAQKELDDAVALFEEQFLELEEFAPTTQIADSLESLNMLWMEFRMEIVSNPELDKAASIINKANVLLKASHQIVLLLQEHLII